MSNIFPTLFFLKILKVKNSKSRITINDADIMLNL